MGVDYSKETRKEDETFLTDMIKTERKTTTTVSSPATTLRKRKIMTPQEAEEHKRQKRDQKRQKKWEKFNYVSKDIVIESLAKEEEEEEPLELEEFNIHFVTGDVTKPQGSGNKIIVNCVDNSGQWGRGGLFSAIGKLGSQTSEEYELAGEMDDLDLGSAHLVDLAANASQEEETKVYIANVIVQSKSKRQLILPKLQEALEKVAFKAKQLNASVHLPRYDTRKGQF